jgi:hypothetical protein
MGAQEGMGGKFGERRIGEQGAEVVGEDEGVGVWRIAFAVGAQVAGAEVTLRVVGGALFLRRTLYLPPPGALSAMRRDQYPFAGEGVQTAMGSIVKVKPGFPRQALSPGRVE